MLREILLQQNQTLLQEAERLIERLKDTHNQLPNELVSYYQWLQDDCLKFRDQIQQNLSELSIDQGTVPPELSILPDILSNTQEATGKLQILNRFTSPILRSGASDRLCLKLISWLHAIHPQTQHIPAAVSDGSFACWPVTPTIYFVPASAQSGLLYLALLFHEFGHLLYACHKPEMDDLVQSLRRKIAEFLEPSSLRDTPYAKREAERRREIVSVWYSWTQELFCDAVGYVIGGNAFAYAFSSFLQMHGTSQYNVASSKIAGRAHPVTWIRVRLLADRMRRMHQVKVAKALEDAWSAIAYSIGVIEDYYGFYEPEFLPFIQQTIDDMLVEAEPYRFANQPTSKSANELVVFPPQLLNEAWLKFLQSPENFFAGEKELIEAFLLT